jgi:predicted XRE-type DNA-binding protein
MGIDAACGLAMMDEFIHKGSGNVFADLGLTDPELCLAKAAMVLKITAIILQRKLTQSVTGEILGLAQPKVSALLNGHLDGFSSDRQLRFLNAFGCDIEIAISRPRPRKQGRLKVT